MKKQTRKLPPAGEAVHCVTCNMVGDRAPSLYWHRIGRGGYLCSGCKRRLEEAGPGAYVDLGAGMGSPWVNR
jgi:hypothetical protein